MNKKNILIAGGCGLIGSTLVNNFIVKNNVVVIDNNKSKLSILKKEKNTNNLLIFNSSISNESTLKKILAKCQTKIGKIDVAINCILPPVNSRKKFEDIDLKYLNSEFNNHLSGSIIFSKVMINHFINNKVGNLINFGSIFASNAPKFNHYEDTKMINPLEYGVIKSGIVYMTKYLAKYLKNKNIRVNCVSPGGILDKQPSKFKQRYKKDSLNKGLLEPNDLVGVIKFLASDRSLYLNGQNIIIDDGWSL